MPNGGSDCCATCLFNGLNKGKSQYPPKNAEKNFFCEIRQFKIDIPYWTYCNNHPRRNPLLATIPRGPIWAAVNYELNCKPLREGVQLPSQLVPPQGDAMSVRIPYYGTIRPIQALVETCHICGEQSQKSISLTLEETDKKFFCSVAHYLEWWLKLSPEAGFYQAQAPFNAEIIKSKLEKIRTNLSNTEVALSVGNTQQLKEVLIELDQLLVEIHYSQRDLLFSEIYLKHPEHRGQLSPHLLRIKATLSHLGNLLQQEQLNIEAILGCLSDIQDNIQRFIAEEA